MDTAKLDLNILKVLQVLFEERHVSRTAKRLNISQPAVSASLARLRRYFDDELFFRAGQGLMPTAYAESLRPAVCDAMEIIDSKVLHSRRFEPSKATCTFTFSTSDIGEAACMLPLLFRLQQAAPACTLSSSAAPPRKLAEKMANGEIDIALGYFPDLDAKCFHSELLWYEPLICLLRRDHPVIGETFSLEQFKSVEHLVVTHEERRHDDYERLIAEKRIPRKVRARICHFTNAPRLLANTDLVATVPRHVASLYADLHQLKCIKLPFPVPDLEVKLYWHQRAHQDAANCWLRKTIIAMSRERQIPQVARAVPGEQATTSVRSRARR